MYKYKITATHMKAKIVVADDEPRIRKMIARLLTDEGYDVMPFENGRE